MEEYRVLLADDEEEIRSGISRKIDWPSLGFTLVGEAGNGEEALELADQLRPDVVLTDIKMPFMDGLELCRRLRVSLPGARLVVFSGFDDFEYARRAMSLGVRVRSETHQRAGTDAGAGKTPGAAGLSAAGAAGHGNSAPPV